MITITPKAEEHLIRTRAEQGLDPSFGARFVRGPNGFALTFAEGPEPLDKVLKTSEMAIYIAENIAGLLDHAIIDETIDDTETTLVIRVPDRGQ